MSIISSQANLSRQVMEPQIIKCSDSNISSIQQIMGNTQFQFYQNTNDTSIDSDNKSNKRRRSRGERTQKIKKGV